MGELLRLSELYWRGHSNAGAAAMSKRRDPARVFGKMYDEVIKAGKVERVSPNGSDFAAHVRRAKRILIEGGEPVRPADQHPRLVCTAHHLPSCAVASGARPWRHRRGCRDSSVHWYAVERASYSAEARRRGCLSCRTGGGALHRER